MNTQKNKIPAVYVNDETHKALKEWSELTGITMPKIAQNVLEESQPMLVEMSKALKDIKDGKSQIDVLQNMLAGGLQIASDRLKIEEDDNVQSSGSSS